MSSQILHLNSHSQKYKKKDKFSKNSPEAALDGLKFGECPRGTFKSPILFPYELRAGLPRLKSLAPKLLVRQFNPDFP